MPSASVVTGVVTTAGPTSNQLIIDMAKEIIYLDPEDNQFTTIMMKLPQERCASFKTEWLDGRIVPALTALAVSVPSTSTQIDVTATEGSYARPGDIAVNALTREAMLISAVSVNSWTVTRGLGTVAAASAVSGAEVVIVGHAASQGSRSPLRVVARTVQNYNYTSIQRHTFGYTETAEATAFYGGSLLEGSRRDKGVEHRRAMEYTCLFGSRYYTATGPRHSCGGLLEFVTSNIRDAAGTFSKGNLQTNLRTDLQYGRKGRKALFVSPMIGMVISNFLQDSSWIAAADPKLRYWGIKVDYVISGAFGDEVPVFVKRDLGIMSTASTQFGGYGFLVDMGSVMWAPLRDTKLIMNTQDNDEDSVNGEWKTEHSLKVRWELHHAIWRGVTG